MSQRCQEALGVTLTALAQYAHEQPAGTDQSGDPPPHAGGGTFPDGQSALMLVAARLRHIASTKWGTRRYLDLERLRQLAVAA